MASNDSRKNEEEVVGKDVAPVVPPENTAPSASAPVATKGEEDSAATGSKEDKLAAAIKAEGVDLVRVWHDEGRAQYYAEMHQYGLKRLLAAEDADVDKSVTEAAKLLVAKAEMSKDFVKAREEARKAAA